jgi:hypothetical protein
MITEWLDVTEVVAFAKEIAGEVDKLYQPSPRQTKPASAKNDLKHRKKLDGLVRRTRAFAQTHKLNVYKKGRFLNTLKWQLRETKHEDSLIDEIVSLLATALA